MSNPNQEPEIPAAISTETLNEWAQVTFEVPTFNELTPQQIDVFEQERAQQWQAYRQHKQQQWQQQTQRIDELIAKPLQSYIQPQQIDQRQAMINEWIANGNSEATIKQKLAYLDKLDEKRQAEQAKNEDRAQMRALKMALADINDKLMHPNTSRTEKANLLKQRFEIAAQLKR